MSLLNAIDIKVVRDLIRTRGQITAIVLVIACGVGVYTGMNSTMRSLESARASYYAEHRFGHVFVSLKRAPESVGRRLASVSGIQTVQTRVVANGTLDVPGLLEAASGLLVSLPDHGRPLVNDLRLRTGRLPRAGAWEEAVASEAFMATHGFSLGQHLRTVIDGTRVDLKIVGTALSPEFTYAAAPGQLFPDDRRFGVFWLGRKALASALDMDGAFNSASFRIGRDAHVDDVIARVDSVLARYGGLGAIARKDQHSAFLLENELRQLQGFAFLIPALFLGVAAFLLNMVLGRLVAGQRGDIAALKAFGYRDSEVGLHYAKLMGVIVGLGWVLGLVLGVWMGAETTQLYGSYYRFPDLVYHLGLRAPAEAAVITAVAAGVGAWSAVRRTVALPPAEAMRPAAPPVYKPSAVQRTGLARLLPTWAHIVFRELERRPLRSVLSVAGVAMATALTIVMAFTADSVRYMLNVQFGLGQREDAQLHLAEPRSTGVLAELEKLPGVLHAEPFRSVPVELVHGRRSENVTISGVPADAHLVGLIDEGLRDVPVAEEGLVLSRKLAEILGVRPGDQLWVKVLEGRRHETEVPVTRVIESFVGTPAYMRLEALCRLLNEPSTLNGARLLVDEARLTELHRAVKQTPGVNAFTSRDTVLRTVSEMLDDNLGAMVGVSMTLALVMAFGVLYNTARITLADRARELATLRVLGFRRSEVAAILVGELALVVVVAIPLGLLAGYGLAAALVRSPGFDTDQFRLPLVVASATYATAVLAVLSAGIVSGWSACRRLDSFNIIEVLKTRD